MEFDIVLAFKGQEYEGAIAVEAHVIRTGSLAHDSDEPPETEVVWESVTRADGRPVSAAFRHLVEHQCAEFIDERFCEEL